MASGAAVTMQFIPGETSLVIAGAWNVAILTPEWVLKNSLGREGAERVNIFMPAGPGGVMDFPKFQLPEFAYIVRPEALIVAPTDPSPECMQGSEDAMARTLGVLSHTPVSGIGHNFEFRDLEPDPERLTVFTDASRDLSDRVGVEWEPAATQIQSVFRKPASDVQVNVTRIFDAGTIIVKFNFHHPVGTTVDATAVLRGERGFERMSENLDFATTLVRSLYGDLDGH